MAIERSKYVPAELESWNEVIEKVKHSEHQISHTKVAVDVINSQEFIFEDEASFILGYN